MGAPGDLLQRGDAQRIQLLLQSRPDAADQLDVDVELGCSGSGLGLLRRGVALGGSVLGGLGAAGQNLGDADRRQILTVTLLAAVILPALLLEDDDLLAAMMLDELRGDRRPGDQRRADLRIAIAGDHQNIGEFDDIAGIAGNLLDIENVFGGNPVLFAACANDSVHGQSVPYPNAPIGAAGNPRTLTAIHMD